MSRPLALPARPFRTGSEQFTYFAGLLGGYAFAAGVTLWACTDGPSLFVADRDAGTRSAPIDRAVANDMETLCTAVRAQLDARPFWTPSAGLRDVPLGALPGEPHG